MSKRMSFIEAMNIIEANNMYITGNDGHEPEEAKYLLKFGTDKRFSTKATFRNGFQVVQFAKYINEHQDLTKEQYAENMASGEVLSWWGQKSAESTREYFRNKAMTARALELEKEIVKNDTDNT